MHKPKNTRPRQLETQVQTDVHHRAEPIFHQGGRVKVEAPRTSCFLSLPESERADTVYWTPSLPGLPLDWRELAGVWNASSQVDLKQLKLGQSGPGSTFLQFPSFIRPAVKRSQSLFQCFQEAVIVSSRGDL